MKSVEASQVTSKSPTLSSDHLVHRRSQIAADTAYDIGYGEPGTAKGPVGNHGLHLTGYCLTERDVLTIASIPSV